MNSSLDEEADEELEEDDGSDVELEDDDCAEAGGAMLQNGSTFRSFSNSIAWFTTISASLGKSASMLR